MTPMSRASIEAAMKSVEGNDVWLEGGRRARIVEVFGDGVQVQWLSPLRDPQTPLVPLPQLTGAVARHYHFGPHKDR